MWGRGVGVSGGPACGAARAHPDRPPGAVTPSRTPRGFWWAGTVTRSEGSRPDRFPGIPAGGGVESPSWGRRDAATLRRISGLRQRRFHPPPLTHIADPHHNATPLPARRDAESRRSPQAYACRTCWDGVTSPDS